MAASDHIHHEVDGSGDGNSQGASPQGVQREVGTEVEAGEDDEGGQQDGHQPPARGHVRKDHDGQRERDGGMPRGKPEAVPVVDAERTS
jgi:hypothetical protein